LKPLAEACKRHGLKLGFYHSQAQDWSHPGGAAWGDKQWDPAQAGDMDEYIRKIAAPQVREILTNLWRHCRSMVGYALGHEQGTGRYAFAVS